MGALERIEGYQGTSPATLRVASTLDELIGVNPYTDYLELKDTLVSFTFYEMQDKGHSLTAEITLINPSVKMENLLFARYSAMTSRTNISKKKEGGVEELYKEIKETDHWFVQWGYESKQDQGSPEGMEASPEQSLSHIHKMKLFNMTYSYSDKKDRMVTLQLVSVFQYHFGSSAFRGPSRTFTVAMDDGKDFSSCADVIQELLIEMLGSAEPYVGFIAFNQDQKDVLNTALRNAEAGDLAGGAIPYEPQTPLHITHWANGRVAFNRPAEKTAGGSLDPEFVKFLPDSKTCAYKDGRNPYLPSNWVPRSGPVLGSLDAAQENICRAYVGRYLNLRKFYESLGLSVVNVNYQLQQAKGRNQNAYVANKLPVREIIALKNAHRDLSLTQADYYLREPVNVSPAPGMDATSHAEMAVRQNPAMGETKKYPIGGVGFTAPPLIEGTSLLPPPYNTIAPYFLEGSPLWTSSDVYYGVDAGEGAVRIELDYIDVANILQSGKYFAVYADMETGMKYGNMDALSAISGRVGVGEGPTLAGRAFLVKTADPGPLMPVASHLNSNIVHDLDFLGRAFLEIKKKALIAKRDERTKDMWGVAGGGKTKAQNSHNNREAIKAGLRVSTVGELPEKYIIPGTPVGQGSPDSINYLLCNIKKDKLWGRIQALFGVLNETYFKETKRYIHLDYIETANLATLPPETVKKVKDYFKDNDRDVKWEADDAGPADAGVIVIDDGTLVGQLYQDTTMIKSFPGVNLKDDTLRGLKGEKKGPSAISLSIGYSGRKDGIVKRLEWKDTQGMLMWSMRTSHVLMSKYQNTVTRFEDPSAMGNILNSIKLLQKSGIVGGTGPSDKFIIVDNNSPTAGMKAVDSVNYAELETGDVVFTEQAVRYALGTIDKIFATPSLLSRVTPDEKEKMKIVKEHFGFLLDQKMFGSFFPNAPSNPANTTVRTTVKGRKSSKKEVKQFYVLAKTPLALGQGPTAGSDASLKAALYSAKLQAINSLKKTVVDLKLECLGMPEMDLFGREMMNRDVQLWVHEPRTPGREHWLSGIYNIREIVHKITLTDGYLMQMTLQHSAKDTSEKWANYSFLQE